MYDEDYLKESGLLVIMDEYELIPGKKKKNNSN
jgi:hypothetical protein